MKKSSIIFFIVLVLQNLSINFVHPVTPTLINNLGLPSYTFGVAYASMATSSFLFSRFWGYLSNTKDNRFIYAFGCVTYGLSQLLFMTSIHVAQIIIARLFAGIAVAAINVSTLNYIVKISSEKEKSRNLSLFTSLTVISTSFGYLIGGYIGNSDFRLSFYSQILVLICCSIIFLILGEKSKSIRKVEYSQLKKTINPIISFDSFLNDDLKQILIIVFLASSASVIYEQTFNYYLKDILHFMPSRTGEIKAISSFVMLFINLTLSYKLLESKKFYLNLSIILFLCAISSLNLTFLSNINMFLISNYIFMAFNSLHVPLIQKRITDNSNDEIFGTYNGLKSLGWITGGLVAGFSYELYHNLPFVLTTSLFIFSIFILNKKAKQSI